MPGDNFTRMIQLADEFFEAKNDPSQLDIDESIIARLQKIHPATMGEIADENGPIAWTIAIPTTHTLMQKFLEKKISEKELFVLTECEQQFDAVYLCSALVLPEHREKGIAKKLACTSLRAILHEHPIRELFYWSFSTEGERLAQAIADELQLSLKRRTE